MATPTSAPPELSEAQPTTSVSQEDTQPFSHPWYINVFSLTFFPVAAKAASLDHFCPFDIEFNHLCLILDDNQFGRLPQLAHSGLIGAIWSAPPAKYILNLGKTMVTHLLCELRNTWTDFHPYHHINFYRYRNQKRSIADHLCYALPYSNIEVSQDKNSL